MILLCITCHVLDDLEKLIQGQSDLKIFNLAYLCNHLRYGLVIENFDIWCHCLLHAMFRMTLRNYVKVKLSFKILNLLYVCSCCKISCGHNQKTCTVWFCRPLWLIWFDKRMKWYNYGWHQSICAIKILAQSPAGIASIACVKCISKIAKKMKFIKMSQTPIEMHYKICSLISWIKSSVFCTSLRNSCILVSWDLEKVHQDVGKMLLCAT